MSLSEFAYIDFIDLLCEIASAYGNFMYFVMIFNVLRTCNLVLPLSHYHLATSKLMKTRHLFILLSHYLAISYHLELPPADGLSLFHSIFTCEHCTREYVLCKQGKTMNCGSLFLPFVTFIMSLPVASYKKKYFKSKYIDSHTGYTRNQFWNFKDATQFTQDKNFLH